MFNDRGATTMKTFRFTLALGAAVLLAAGGTQAFAHPAKQTTKTVTVVMHDPGCHWFAVGKSFKTSLAVKGPVALRNVDEAALKVAGPHGTKLDPVGKELVLGHGVYHITMVGQAVDDNHLTLDVM
jgi:hypothetical protein